MLYEAQMCAVGDTVHGKLHTDEDLLHFGMRIARQIQGAGGEQGSHGRLTVHNISGRNILIPVDEGYGLKGIADHSPHFCIVGRKATVDIVVRTEMRVCLFFLFPVIRTYLKENRQRSINQNIYCNQWNQILVTELTEEIGGGVIAEDRIGVIDLAYVSLILQEQVIAVPF